MNGPEESRKAEVPECPASKRKRQDRFETYNFIGRFIPPARSSVKTKDCDHGIFRFVTCEKKVENCPVDERRSVEDSNLETRNSTLEVEADWVDRFFVDSLYHIC